MKNSASLYIYNIYFENRKILIVNFFIFCFLCGTELRQAQAYNFGIWGYIITILTNHYYVLYCLLPIIFIVLTRYIRNIRNIEIIRYKNKSMHIRRVVSRFLGWLVTYFILKVVIVLLIGIKTFGLSIHSETFDVSVYDELLIIYNEYVSIFRNSFVAVIGIVIYFILGFTLLVAVLGYINNKYGYKKVMMISLFIYMLTMIGFKTELKSTIPFICFNNYILLHHGLFVNGIEKFVILVVVAIFIMLFCLGYKVKFKTTGMNNLIITSRDKLITIIFVVSLISIELFRNYSNQDFNIRDTMLKVMFGSSESMASFMSWLKLSILYVLPLFFIGSSDQRLRKYCQLPTLVRFKHANLFTYKVLLKDLQYMLIYVLTLWGIGCVTYYLGGESPINTEFMIENFGVGYTINIWHIFIVGFSISLLADFVTFKLLSKFFGEIAGIILVLLSKFIFYTIPMSNFFGMNFGLSQLYENLHNGYMIDGGQAILIIIITIYISIIVIRRFRHGNHSN